MESNLQSVGDVAFLLHQKRLPFTAVAGRDKPTTTLLLLEGSDMFSRYLLHTRRYTEVREKVPVPLCAWQASLRCPDPAHGIGCQQARTLRRFPFLARVPRTHAIRLAFETTEREFAYGAHVTVAGRPVSSNVCAWRAGDSNSTV